MLVVGEAKRGKSMLVNALLGHAVLPAGVTPLTAVTTTVRYGDEPQAEMRFFDGHEKKHPLEARHVSLAGPVGHPRHSPRWLPT